MTTPPFSRVPRVIVADDHEWILQILVSVVHQTLPSAEVIVAENGLQAFEAYQQGGADFLITNHQMPEMNGMELIHQVRGHQPDLPILMVSVHPDARKDAMEAGANWFLSKTQITEQMPALLRRHAVPGRAAHPSKFADDEPV